MGQGSAAFRRLFLLCCQDIPGSPVVPHPSIRWSAWQDMAEGLVYLESLVGEKEIVFVGFPLKFEDGDGAPLRATALVY